MDNNNTIIGIDPSFSRTGIAVLDTGGRHIILLTASHRAGKKWHEVVLGASSLADDICGEVAGYGARDVFCEAPIIGGIASPGLWALGQAIYNSVSQYATLHYAHPSQLTRFHGKRGDKTASLTAAQSIIDGLSGDYGFDVDYGGRKICHDCAEALIYAVCGYVALSPDNDLSIYFKSKYDYNFDITFDDIII